MDIENEFINAPENLDDPILVEFLNNRGEEVYTEEYHLKNYNKVTNIYNEFKTTLKLLINNLNITCLKHYINFKNAEDNICSVEVTKGYLKICFTCNDLKNIDKSILKDVSNLGHLGNGNCIYNLSSKDEISTIVKILRENNLIKNN